MNRLRCCLRMICFFLLAQVACTGNPTTNTSTAQVQVEIELLTTPDPDWLLSEMSQRAFDFFWNESHVETGLTKDRANNTTSDTYKVSSIASTGYALTALCLRVTQGSISYEQGYERARLTLQFLLDMPHEHGFLYHFVNWATGERVWGSEASSIDTALMLAGAITVGQCFPNTEVAALANQVYERVDWNWLRTNGGQYPQRLLISHGYRPENGFIPYLWDYYSEHMILYILALGSPTHPIPQESWAAWHRLPQVNDIIAPDLPLFIHQFSHLYLDLESKTDHLGYNYFANSVAATWYQWQFVQAHTDQYQTYDRFIWGLSASDSPNGYGYRAFSTQEHEGVVSPAAVAASLIFTPELATASLQAFYTKYPQSWGRYGFVSALSKDTTPPYFADDVIGIELGPSLIAIHHNLQDGFVHDLFMSHPAIQRGMMQAGFVDVQP